MVPYTCHLVALAQAHQPWVSEPWGRHVFPPPSPALWLVLAMWPDAGELRHKPAIEGAHSAAAPGPQLCCLPPTADQLPLYDTLDFDVCRMLFELLHYSEIELIAKVVAMIINLAVGPSAPSHSVLAACMGSSATTAASPGPTGTWLARPSLAKASRGALLVVLSPAACCRGPHRPSCRGVQAQCHVFEESKDDYQQLSAPRNNEWPVQTALFKYRWPLSSTSVHMYIGSDWCYS